MPEGDSVFQTARRLHAALSGHELTIADLRWPSLATADLVGDTTIEVVASGKHILIGSRPVAPSTPTSRWRVAGG
jgi:endonuclease-8